MAALPYRRIVASKMFTILVGPDKKACTIHADLLAAMAGPFNALVNGKMREATEAMAEWPETDEETFARFSEFAYTGRYGSPQDQSATGGDEVNCDDVSWGFGGKKKPGRKQKKMVSLVDASLLDEDGAISAVRSHFASLTYDGVSPPRPIAKEPEETEPPTFAGIVLSHARVYVFADYYLLDDLAKLSLKNLHESLSSVSKDQEIGDALEKLAEYTYSNTVDKGDRQDPLREQVSAYIADHIETMWSSPSFQSVLETCGELSKDVIGMVVSRLRRDKNKYNAW